MTEAWLSMALRFSSKTMSLEEVMGNVLRSTSRTESSMPINADILKRRLLKIEISVRKVVTHTPFRDNILGLCRVKLQLFTQAADVHIHGACIAQIIIAPDKI